MSNLWVIPEELGEYSTSEYAYEACQTASFFMWGLSGRKYNGVSTVTERYEPNKRTIDRTAFFNQSVLTSGSFGVWGPLSTSVPIGDLRLRTTPVVSVSSIVHDDGTVIAPDTYTIRDKTWIHFLSPVSRAVEVTYTAGVLPPMAGRMAARALALQFAKLWEGADDCELPDRVTSVSRQGLTVTVLDNQQFIDDLKTGVYQIDLFLKTVNPDKARNRSKVFSPDISRGHRLSGSRIHQNSGGGWNIVPRGGQ